MGSVVGSAVYQAGHRVEDVEIERLDLACDAIQPEPGRFVWIGLYEPDEEVLRKVQRRFGLHDLAVEDAHNAHQRPKLEAYGESIFVVLRTVQLVDGHVCFGETHIFAGRGYVVTVRHGSSVSYAGVRGRCERTPRMLALGEIFVIGNSFRLFRFGEGFVEAEHDAGKQRPILGRRAGSLRALPTAEPQPA